MPIEVVQVQFADIAMLANIRHSCSQSPGFCLRHSVLKRPQKAEFVKRGRKVVYVVSRRIWPREACRVVSCRVVSCRAVLCRVALPRVISRYLASRLIARLIARYVLPPLHRMTYSSRTLFHLGARSP